MPQTDLPSPKTDPSHPADAGKPTRAGVALLFVVLAVLGGLFHFASGSPWSELGAHPDEAAHYVTGLMVHDYLISGFHESPLKYADEYYRHYPKIGLGVWPPFFYLVQAVWTLVVPGGIQTALRLMYLLGLGLALTTALCLWREYGWVEGATGGLLMTALPLAQMYANMVMAETLSALLMFGAMICFARYLDEVKWGDAIGFGVLAGLAIMTKGTGLALAPAAALAIILTRNYDVLKQKSLWVAVALVVVIAGPWTWHFHNQGRGGWEEASPSLAFTKAAMGYYGREICVALGAMLAVLAAAGAVSLYLPGARKRTVVHCSLALALGVWIFQCLTPVGKEARHLMPAMPALVVLAVAGLHAITARLPQRGRLAGALVVLTLFFAWPAVTKPAYPQPGYGSIGNAVAFSPFRIPDKRWSGFQPIAIKAMGYGPQTRILIDSDARGEGMLIAEVAARDPHRPSYTVERASKLLAASTWSGSGYESLYNTVEEVRRALADAGIGLVVTDESVPSPKPHEILLREAMAGHMPMDRSSAERDGVQYGGITLTWITELARAPR